MKIEKCQKYKLISKMASLIIYKNCYNDTHSKFFLLPAHVADRYRKQLEYANKIGVNMDTTEQQMTDEEWDKFTEFSGLFDPEYSNIQPPLLTKYRITPELGQPMVFNYIYEWSTLV